MPGDGRVHEDTVLTPGYEGGHGDADASYAIDAARELLARAGEPVPHLDGYRLASQATTPDVRAYRTVVVTLRNTDTGRRASYGLSPRGFDVAGAFLIGAPEPVTIPGQDRPLDRFAVNPAAAPGDADQYLYLGQWSGADVFVGRYLEPAPTNPMFDEDLRAIAGTLRPATSAEWEAVLATATGQVDERAHANALADLIVQD
jgi:hypothetical protein